eukprot:3317166-Prymnesium_polylepis.1
MRFPPRQRRVVFVAVKLVRERVGQRHGGCLGSLLAQRAELARRAPARPVLRGEREDLLLNAKVMQVENANDAEREDRARQGLRVPAGRFVEVDHETEGLGREDEDQRDER